MSKEIEDLKSQLMCANELIDELIDNSDKASIKAYKKELIKKLEEEAVTNVNFVKVIRLETAIQLIKKTI